MTRAFTFFVALSACAAGNAIPAGLGNRPLAFEPNRGQAAPPVRFLARGNTRDYLLNGSGLTVLGASLRFAGANPEPKLSALDRLAERHNYFHGAQSQRDIPTYRRVRYSRLYPGIDCVFYGDQKGLEFDFEVSPGADPDKIRLRWNDAKRVRLEANGELVIDTVSGELRQRKPTVYQERDGQRISIDGGYVLAANGEIRFSLGRYDRTLPIVIDPVLFALNQGVATVYTMATDSAGNIYYTGATDTSVLPTTAGTVQPAFGGGTCVAIGFGSSTFPCFDAFVIKLNSTGQLVYATYLGGDGNDFARAIAVDSSGNSYVGGSTVSRPNNFPTTPNAAFPKPSANGNDGFITKLNSAGNQLIYSTFIPGATLGGIALDTQGNVYMAGYADPQNTPFPVTAGAFQSSTSTTSIIGVVAKLNAAGSALVYATYLGGTGLNSGDAAGGIAVDPSGAAYVTGSAESPDFPTTPGAFQRQLHTGSAFVTKLAPSGASLIYSTFLGGTAGGYGSTIRVDSEGDAIVLGATNSRDFPVTSGAFQPTGPGAAWMTDQNISTVLSKLNATGSALVYSTFISGGSALDVDGAGNAYVLGEATYGFPTTPGAYQACSHGGSSDLFAAEFGPDGKLSGATYLGGSDMEIPYAIVALGGGSIYLAGNTRSFDFPGIVGASNLDFVAKILIDDPSHPNGPCLAYTIQNGATFVEGPIVAGEIVTLRGAGIGPQTAAFGKIGPDGKISTELAGVQVFFDEIPAPLLYVQSQQINAVVPWEAVSHSFSNNTRVRVEYNGASSNTSIIQMSDAAPGIFVTDYSTLEAAVLNADGTPNSPSHPAKRGSVVTFFGTGGGATNPPGVTGGLWPKHSLAHLKQPVTVQMNGIDAEVLYAGSAPGMVSGIFQINVRVPDSRFVAGQANIVVTIGGAPSPQSTAFLAVD